MAFDESLKARFMTTDPAQVGHFIEGGFMHPSIKPLFKKAKMIGPAFTVRMPVNDSAILYYAIDRAPKGSVLVIDRVGDPIYACTGGVVATCAKNAGLAGIVVDGPATDSIYIEEELEFPVFSKGLSPVTTKLMGITGQIDVDIQCGGAVVHPGDLIFGDADGVIVIPPDRAEELIAKAEQMDIKEAAKMMAFKEGKTQSDFVNINRLVENDTMAYINSLRSFD